jgi:hypothetical protein
VRLKVTSVISPIDRQRDNFLRDMAVNRQANEPGVILIGEVFHPLLRLLHCANAFYEHVGYRGNIEATLAVTNVRAQKLPFLRDPYRLHPAENYECFEDTVSVSQRSSSELLRENLHEIVQDVLRQISWSFWQSAEEFPANALHDYIEEIIGRMGL